MIERKNFKLLYDNRKNGKMNREEYWTEIGKFLIDLEDFALNQKDFGTNIEITGGNIIVNLKATSTHDCRLSMILDPTDIRSVPFSVLADSFYEPFQSDILLELGNKSRFFIDIGANRGFYSIALALENPTLSVQSYEPQPSVHAKLSANIKINGLSERIQSNNIALGRISDTLTMFIPKFTGSSGASFMNLHEDEGEATRITVPVKVLDEIYKEEVDLIKIDVEGFELNVLLGAQETVKRARPTIVVELLRKWMKPFGHTPQMFVDYLRSNGYLCFAIGSDTLLEIQEINELTLETNFIFIHRDNADHLRTIRKPLNR